MGMLEEIFKLLHAYSAVDFSKYRNTTIMRRINRRMNLSKQKNLPAYFSFLEKHPAEIEQLFQDLLLSYTHFFRDPLIFEILKKKVFPELVKHHSVRKPIRIWIPGCSTGEELYSMAICMYEFMEQRKLKIPVQFFGTDLVEKNIIKARTGLFSDKIKEEMSRERLDRFFDKTPEGLRAIKHIREMCVFAVHDITKDPPFPGIDLISCRNVMIYFNEEHQDAAIPRFHFSLNPNGFLLLGSSETMGRFTDLFNITDNKSNLYTKRSTHGKPLYNFPITREYTKLKASVMATPNHSPVKDDPEQVTSQINKMLLDAYAPSGVLVDSKLQILQFVGDRHPYLAPTSGDASLNLSNMTGNALMPDIYVAIEEAKKKNDKVRKRNVVFNQNGQIKTTDLCVMPVENQKAQETNFLILFEKTETLPPASAIETTDGATDQSKTSELQRELQKTKQYLQAIIEEREEVNAELWAANEEIMSTNEELQSVNEEMEAAKEELESGNEELLALNEELHIKNQNISESEEKHRTLLKNINAGVIVYAPDNSILMANDQASHMLGITVDQIIGKTAIDPAWGFIREDGSPLPKDEYPAHRVISNGETIRNLTIGIHRPQQKDVAWVLVHAFPESHADGTLRQVVVTFVDITELTNSKEEIKILQKRYRAWLEYSPICTKVLDSDFNLQFMSSAGVRQMHIDDITPFYGKPYPLPFYPEEFKTQMAECMKKARDTREVVKLEGFVEDREGVMHWYHSTIVPIFNGSELHYMMIVSVDNTERKLAEEALRKREQEFRMVTETIQDVFWMSTTGATEMIYVSPAYEKLWGKSTRELYASPQAFQESLLPEDLKGYREMIEKYHSKGKAYECEYRIIHTDGDIRWIHERAYPIADEQGKVSMMTGICTDITKRKLAEFAQKESEEKFHKAFNLNPNTLAIIDINTLERIAVNDYFAEIVGYSKEELMKHPLGSLGEIDIDKVQLALDTIRKGARLSDVEVNLKDKQGNTRVMLYAIEPIRVSGRSCMIVSGKDITKEKKTQQELKESKERFELAMLASKDGIFDWNLITNEIYFSPGWKHMLGYTDAELPNEISVWKSLTHPEDAKKAWKLIQKGISGEIDRFDIEFKMRHKKKYWVDIYSRTEIFFDENHVATRIVGTHVDNTERKKAERHLKQALAKAKESDRLKSAFLSNMSHEIRTPMNGILGFTNLLKEENLSELTKEGYLQIIEKSGKRMLDTINAIIDISKIEAGQAEVIQTHVSVNEILEEQHNFFNLEATSKGLDLIYQPTLTEEQARVITDKHKLESILSNLLKNAIKFTTKGRVHFGCSLKSKMNELEFFVSDTGIGIPKDRVGAIFNRFEQADIEDRSVFEGSGLGLSISKAYVDIQGGKIGVQSEEGTGTTFTFCLPYIQQPKIACDTGKSQNKKEALSSKSWSFIIAEDDEASLMFFKALFKDRSDKIIYTTNGKETIEKFRENPDTDVILMDIKMPEMNGYQATRAIRKFNPDVVIIAQTAHGLKGDKEKAIAAGCNDYITKPINKELLFEIIKLNLEKSGIE